MNKFVAIGLGAAAVVVALFIGAQIFGGTTPGGPAVRNPIAKCGAVCCGGRGARFQPRFRRGTDLRPGEYFFDHDAIPRVTVTVPVGWEKNMPDFVIWSVDDNKATLAVMSVNNVYIDPCDPTLQLRDPVVGPTADDLVAALGTVPGWEFSPRPTRGGRR